MKNRNIILKGAFILTVTGFITRIMGFFYRIFLSQTFGEEGVGIYQLIFPIYALGFSLTCAGIETAISRNVANKYSTGKYSQAKATLYAGCSISLLLSIIFMYIVQNKSVFLATNFLNEPRCESLLVILSYAFPFAAFHSCICGYYLGLKQTKIPALSQLIEQVFRVCGVYLIFVFLTKKKITPNISLAVIGLVLGELASCFYCIFSYRTETNPVRNAPLSASLFLQTAKEISIFAVPLTGNRILLNILQSIEAVSIPARLQMYGFTTSQSLSIYGVLTGMALPCILFPSAITNSIASIMLPTIAEIQATDNLSSIRNVVKKIVFYCTFLGLACCFFLFLTGSFIGEQIFHSNMAGEFIMTLCWMCPFLYSNSNLISIINGLGKTTISFFINTLGLSLRILSVFFLIPSFGIRGYLIGLLASQLVIFIASIGFIFKSYRDL